jgi:hypothetical protein
MTEKKRGRRLLIFTDARYISAVLFHGFGLLPSTICQKSKEIPAIDWR